MRVSDRPGRRIVRTQEAAFQAYALEGPVQKEISWSPISYDPGTGNGCYLMRMQPGAVTIVHHHEGVEDFLVLEGELIDDDGTVFRPGDFISYAAGTRHNSRTLTGCLIAVFEWGKAAGEANRPTGAAADGLSMP